VTLDGIVPALRQALKAAALPPVRPGQRVTLIVPDATRPLPVQDILPVLLPLWPKARVTVLVGLGLHRPMSGAELRPWAEACHQHGATLKQHTCDQPLSLVTCCTDVGGGYGALPAILHEDVVQCDLRMVLGIVEPHQYAGFSGGAKAVAIGCAGHQTISSLHNLTRLNHPDTRLGQVRGNVFQAALWRVVQGLPLFAVQVVPSEPAQVFIGPARPTFDQAVQAAEASLFVQHSQRYPAVIVPVPPEKAQSFYQASRAATYLAEVPEPVLEHNGAIVLQAACPEGLGLGAGELAFAEALSRGPQVLMRELQAGTRVLRGGEQRAYVLARVLERFRLAIVGAPPMPELGAFGVVQAASLDEAQAQLGLEAPPVELLHVFHRVPRYRGSQG